MLDGRKLQALRELLDPEVVAAWLDEVDRHRGKTVTSAVAVPRAGDGSLLTVKEVAEKLQVSVNAVYQLAHRQDIPSLHIGRSIRFSSALVDEWIANGGVPPVPQSPPRRRY